MDKYGFIVNHCHIPNRMSHGHTLRLTSLGCQSHRPTAHLTLSRGSAQPIRKSLVCSKRCVHACCPSVWEEKQTYIWGFVSTSSDRNRPSGGFCPIDKLGPVTSMFQHFCTWLNLTSSAEKSSRSTPARPRGPAFSDYITAPV